MRKEMLFLLTILLASLPGVLAYSIDGFCEGEANPTFYFGSNEGWEFDNVTESFSYEYVDSSYNPLINGTALHLTASGGVDKGVSMGVWLENYGYNATLPFNISVVKFKIYNISATFLGTDLYAYIWDHDDTGETYGWYFLTRDFGDSYYPVELYGDFNLTYFHTLNYIEESDAECECWRQFNNGTIIEGYADSCPVEFRNIDFFFMNFPPYFNPYSFDWDYDLIIDDMVVMEDSEDSHNSPDCAVEIGSISDIYNDWARTNYRWVKFDAVNVGTEELFENAIYRYLRYDYTIFGMMLTDDSHYLIYEYQNLGSDTPYIYNLLYNEEDADFLFDRTKLWEIVGYTNTYYTGENGFLEANIGIYNITEMGTADGSFYTPISYPGGKEDWNFNTEYCETYLEEDFTSPYFYRWFVREGDNAVIFNLDGSVFANVSLANPSSTLNFSYYRFLDSDLITDMSSFTRLPTEIESGSYKMIFRGVCQENYGGDYWGNILSLDGYPAMETDFVGDGECGSLESGNPSSWNYSPDCYSEGDTLTGLAVAGGTTLVNLVAITSVAYVVLGSLGISLGLIGLKYVIGVGMLVFIFEIIMFLIGVI